MAVITMRQMLEAGAHFGHQTRRWNPKMKRFIFGERNGIYIIDLEQTLGRVEQAYGFVRDLVAGGGTILFVGTKKQAQDPVRSYAEKCGMPYVNERWLGGMLTNFETISKRVSKMLEYERMQASGEFDAMIKKEALLLDRELTKLQRNLGGLRGLKQPPDAIFVLDTKKEHIAVTEANKLGIPVVAVVDTNVDPELIQYPIPGNDDAIRSNGLFARVIADAVEEGRFIANKRSPEPPAAAERTPEEAAAFDAEQAAARAAAAQAQAQRDARLAAADQPVVAAAAGDAARLVGETGAPDAVVERVTAETAADVAEQVATTPADETIEPGTVTAPASADRATSGPVVTHPEPPTAAAEPTATGADTAAAGAETSGETDAPAATESAEAESAESGAAEAAESGATGSSEAAESDAPAATESAESGATGSAEAAESGATGSAEAAESGATESAEAAESGATGSAESGAAESGTEATEAAEAGAREADGTESGAAESADTAPTATDETPGDEAAGEER